MSTDSTQTSKMPARTAQFQPSTVSHQQIRSPSVGVPSPAASLIFERNVQEQPIPDELSAAIPHHIQTEDHIPPILEASSIAITDDHLNPDEVEIVTHSVHQPAAQTFAGLHPEDTSGTLSPFSTHESGTSAHHDYTEEMASSYGALDNADIRRLSFISFADVVQSEHLEANNKESGLHMSFSAVNNHPPSPMRSPASSNAIGTSPPPSGATSMKGMDISSSVPNPLRLPGSPVSYRTQSPPLGSELMVETMRQTIRKTESGDLSGARNPSISMQPLSALSLEDAHADAVPTSR